MANSNTAVANNSALATGKSVDGTVRYKGPTANPIPIFAAPTTIPTSPGRPPPARPPPEQHLR